MGKIQWGFSNLYLTFYNAHGETLRASPRHWRLFHAFCVLEFREFYRIVPYFQFYMNTKSSMFTSSEKVFLQKKSFFLTLSIWFQHVLGRMLKANKQGFTSCSKVYAMWWKDELKKENPITFLAWQDLCIFTVLQNKRKLIIFEI